MEEKIERESEGKVSCDIINELATISQNSLAGSSNSECQTVARDHFGPEIAASSSQNALLCNTSSPRISGWPQVLPDRVLRSIAATSGS